MPVTTEHPDYEARKPDWQLIADFGAGGDRKVKAQRQTYLPKLSGQDDASYDAYLKRAPFFGATGRTREGLLGAIFRKAPIIAVPKDMDAVIGNINRGGIPLQTFARFVVAGVLSAARHGILVDVPSDGGDPYFASYSAMNIVNWRVGVVNGEPVTQLVVLRESAEARGGDAGDDEFDTKKREQYRVLRLDGRGVYTQQVYTKREGASGEHDGWLPGDVITPMQIGRPMDRIPFVVIGANTLGFADTAPPLLDVATMNRNHYTLAADWRHGLHFTGLPTPWVASDTIDPNSTLPLGAETAWNIGSNGQAGMLEFTGQGLTAVENGLNRIENLMATLGARLLEDQKNAAEAVGTVRMRHSGENSILAAVADNVSAGLSKALELARDFMTNVSGDVSCALNTDFFDQPMTAQDLTALVTGWQSGAYPQEVVWDNMRRGELIPEDWDTATLEGKMRDEAPPGMMGRGTGEGGGPGNEGEGTGGNPGDDAGMTA